MTDQSLRRTDELLTELVEIVETARTVPMSSSCVLPRERVLDLLDALRETMPPEMDQARRTLDQRDDLIAQAEASATATRAAAEARDAASAEEAAAHYQQVVTEAQQHAKEIIDAGRTEHAKLVSATAIHQAARESADALRAEATAFQNDARAAAEREAGDTRAEAQQRAAEIRGAAQAYAAKLTTDAETYADTTLGELAATLQKAATTAEQGRLALARRRDERDPIAADGAPEPVGAEPASASTPVSAGSPKRQAASISG